MQRSPRPLLTLSLAVLVASVPALVRAQELSADEAQAIAREAYIYDFSIVEKGQSMYAVAVDQEGDQYQAPLNKLKHRDRGQRRMSFPPPMYENKGTDFNFA